MNREAKIQELNRKNQREIRRGCNDIFETARGKYLLETIRDVTPKLDDLAKQTIMLEVRKAYRSAKNSVTGEIVSGDLEFVCNEAIKAENRKPSRLLKRLFAA